jgi:hypothetical protein
MCIAVAAAVSHGGAGSRPVARPASRVRSGTDAKGARSAARRLHAGVLCVCTASACTVWRAKLHATVLLDISHCVYLAGCAQLHDRTERLGLPHHTVVADTRPALGLGLLDDHLELLHVELAVLVLVILSEHLGCGRRIQFPVLREHGELLEVQRLGTAPAVDLD